jgi:hypothetical protein
MGQPWKRHNNERPPHSSHSTCQSRTFRLRLAPMKNLTATICVTTTLLLGSAGVSFALPPCPGSYSKYTWSNCFGTVESGGHKYVGEFKDGKPNRQGTVTYSDGRKYVGEYKYGKKNGQGAVTYPAGSKYVGEFKNDKISGQGASTYANGNKYVGEWRDDKFNGQGTFTHANGDKYIGKFRDGKMNGRGTSIHADGQIEEGIWKNNVKVH